MPALPWIHVDTAVHDAHLTIIASRLPLRSHRHVPRFLWHTWLVHRQLARSPGLVGYSIDARLLGKTFWTVSAWTNRPRSRRVRPLQPAPGRQAGHPARNAALDLRNVDMLPRRSANHLAGGPRPR